MPDAARFAAPEWYLRWVDDYAASFGTSDDLTNVMVRAWWPAFAAAGFVERDFAAALPRLLTAPKVPNWPREHLAAVNRELSAAREERTRRADPATVPDGERCGACGWTGWVEVPHPACVRGGEWRPPYRLGCVACTRCGPGRRKYDAACAMAADKQLAAGRPMTLGDYERLVDGAWAEHLFERAEAERLMREAEAHTDVAAKRPAAGATLGTIAQTLAKGMAPPTDRPNTKTRRAA